MKKVFFVCMTVGLLATSCDWFKKTEPSTEPIVETPIEGEDSTIVTTTDSTVQKKDSTVAVVEKTDAKKDVKK